MPLNIKRADTTTDGILHIIACGENTAVAEIELITRQTKAASRGADDITSRRDDNRTTSIDNDSYNNVLNNTEVSQTTSKIKDI